MSVWKTADGHMYVAANESYHGKWFLICLECRLINGQSVVSRGFLEGLEHLIAHKKAGHNVTPFHFGLLAQAWHQAENPE